MHVLRVYDTMRVLPSLERTSPVDKSRLEEDGRRELKASLAVLSTATGGVVKRLRRSEIESETLRLC